MRAFPTILFTLALALIGYALLPRLSVRWQPSAGRTELYLSYGWPGADPAALEQAVTAPLEGALSLVRGIERLYSVSSQNQGYIRLELDPAVPAERIRYRVAAQVRRVFPRLPPEVSYPTLDFRSAENDAAERPVLSYTLSGPDPPPVLFRYAQEVLRSQMGLLPGLDRIEIVGGNRDHWCIEFHPDRLAAAGLTAAGLREAVAANFQREGLGPIQDGERTYFSFLAGATVDPAPSIADWRAISLPASGERLVRLGDVATITRAELPPRAYYRVDGQNSIRLLAYATPRANRLELATALRERAAALTPTLPAGYALALEEDRTRYIRQELAKVRSRTAISLGILLLFVALVYRSARYLVAIAASLFVNLGLAFGLYYLLGVELNLYAFAGIAVSFGIMIDNSIVVLDGLRGRRGAPLAPALLGATLTTIAGLSVIYFLGEELRTQLYELARVIGINLGVSLFVSLVFVPGWVALAGSGKQNRGDVALSAYPVSSTNRPPRWRVRLYRAHRRLLRVVLRYRKTALLGVVLLFGLPVFWLPPRVADWDFYNETLGSSWYQDELRPHVNRWLGGTFRLFSVYVYEGSGFRPPEETRLFVQAALPPGARLDQLDAVLRQVEGFLAGYDDRIARYTTQANSGQFGQIEIEFPAGGELAFPFQLKARLTSFAVDLGGVEWSIYGVGQGFSNRAGGQPPSYRVMLKGYAQAALDRQAGRLAQLLLQHPRIQEVDTDANLNWWDRDRYEWQLDFDYRALARAAVAPAELRAALDNFDRSPLPDFYLPGFEPVRLVPAFAESFDRWQLANRELPRDSLRIGFSALADLQRTPAANALHKEDQQYLRLIQYEYMGSGRFGSRYLDAVLDTLRAELPLGFTAERDTWSYNRTAREWSGLLGLVVIFIFFICALLFESLRQALVIVLLIPISFIGIFLTFYLFELRLDQGGYTSFLLVSGLVVNGLILILNEYNYLRKQQPHRSALAAYLRAYHYKIRPIVLTVLSTALGLVPFLLGGNQEIFWHGLAAGTIGGLVFSLALLAVVSPLFVVGGDSASAVLDSG